MSLSLSTLQLVVAGALAAAWLGLFGRSLLESRSWQDRASRPRGAAAPSVPGGSWSTWIAPQARPLWRWRQQRIEKRRLQLLLGFAFATFVSMLLAIALRGEFVTLLLVMVAASAVQLSIAAAVGNAQLRRAEARRRMVRSAPAPARGSVPAVVEAAQPAEVAEAGLVDVTARSSGRSALFDESFFEPIPELQFEPLNLEREEEPAPNPEEGPQVDTTFRTPPARRALWRRERKARPIYREPEPEPATDGEKGQARAVNDR